jgi:small redox-active disulfide protein 2
MDQIKRRVEVLGPGCEKCRRLAENACAAAGQAGVEIELVKVEDMFDILARGCNRTPGIIIDGRLRLQGRIATVNEIAAWLKG